VHDPVQFYVAGDPKPQGSKRHVGHGIMVESSRGLKPWRKKVAKAAADAGGGITFDGPLGVRVVFFIARPKSHLRTGRHAGFVKPNAPRWQIRYPDIEKLQRGLFDALTDSGLIEDDARICEVEAQKVYGDPGVLVEVRELQ
jgi:crossover junction endodeoxyribonuclease RusA